MMERGMPRSLYRFIWSVNPRGQIKLIVLTAFVFPLSVVPLELQRRIVDDAIVGEDFNLLLLLGFGYMALMVVHGGLKFLMNVKLARVSQQATSHLREAVYYCIYSVIPPKYLREADGDAVDQGTVVSMLASEVEKLGQFIGGSFSTPLLQGGTMVAVLGYMIWVEPRIALIGLLVYSPQMIMIPLMQRRINGHNQDYSERVRELGDFVVENAETVERTKEVPDRFSAIVKDMFEDKMNALRLKFTMKFFRNLISGLGPLSILVVGGWLVIQGEAELGTIVAFLSGFERISGPWSELIGFYREVSNARMKYAMLVDAFPEFPENAGPVPQPHVS